ncbi:hypothetical protein C8Q77DRAFT_575254 [Trametes polyzona]|nr:hypothetical protein C8Q77DRAFT_575254 [Trametes polyzona]
MRLAFSYVCLFVRRAQHWTLSIDWGLSRILSAFSGCLRTRLMLLSLSSAPPSFNDLPRVHATLSHRDSPTTRRSAVYHNGERSI